MSSLLQVFFNTQRQQSTILTKGDGAPHLLTRPEHEIVGSGLL